MQSLLKCYLIREQLNNLNKEMYGLSCESELSNLATFTFLESTKCKKQDVDKYLKWYEFEVCPKKDTCKDINTIYCNINIINVDVAECNQILISIYD